MTLATDLEILARAEALGLDLSSQVRSLAALVEAAETLPADVPHVVTCSSCHGEGRVRGGNGNSYDCGRCDPCGPEQGFTIEPPAKWLEPGSSYPIERYRPTYQAWCDVAVLVVRLGGAAKEAKRANDAFEFYRAAFVNAARALGGDAANFRSVPATGPGYTLEALRDWMRARGATEQLLKKAWWSREDDDS